MNSAHIENRKLKRIAKLLPQFKAAVERVNALKAVKANEEAIYNARIRRNTLFHALREYGYPVDEYWERIGRGNEIL